MSQERCRQLGATGGGAHDLDLRVRRDDGVTDEVQDHPGIVGLESSLDQGLTRLGYGPGEDLVSPGNPHDDIGQAGIALQHLPDGLGMCPNRVGPALPGAGNLDLGGDPLQAGGQQVLS